MVEKSCRTAPAIDAMRKNQKTKHSDTETSNVMIVQNAVQDEEDTITIPVAEIFHQLRKYVLLWVLIAVVAAGLVFGGSLVAYSSKSTPLTAMVGFSYDGIESGLDPNGNEFDANSIKTPSIIQETLSDLGLSEKSVDLVRNGLTISGVVPEDTIDELTAYKSIFDSTNSIEAAKQMMDVSYYPTQFEVQFQYTNLGLSRSQAADLLNTLLSNYRTYFMRTYGFNKSFGDALNSVDYTGYDYPQALDLLNNSLNSLQNYVSTLVDNDNTRFRSAETGYTFTDLQAAVSTLKTVDYATLTSYVLGKNVTKDKSSLETYYQYQIDTLNRSLTGAQEKLNTIIDSINKYQKDSYVLMASADGTTSNALTQPSEAYDDLISQKTDAQSDVSSYQSRIKDYQTRLDTLKKTAVASKADQEKVDQDMEAICNKLNQVIADVNQTADEYFETASYANAYNVLVPASGSTSSAIHNAISNMTRPLMIAEALLFVVYLVFSVVRAFQVSYRREKLAAGAAEDETEPAETAEAEKTETEKKEQQ